MKRKKNRFLTFLCSLVPGAGEMYMGFMKMGLSLLIIFMGIIVVAAFTEITELVFVAIVVWIYSFFHANNLAGMPDNDFQELEDKYMLVSLEEQPLSRNLQKLIAGLLIFFGVILLGESFLRMLPDFLWEYLSPILHYLPRMGVAVILILLGIKLIQGKKEVLEEKSPYTADTSSMNSSQPKQAEPPKNETAEAATESQNVLVQTITPELPAPDNNPQ